MKKCFYLFLFSLSFSLCIQASHIVGGQLYYDCLGNNQYRITFVEYRNCSSSCVQCAPYGNPEYVQIFDTAGNYIDSIAIPMPQTDILPVTNNVSCFSAADYCVEIAYYQSTVTLPNRAGGYVLVYQRCCRNGAVMNIAANIGTTYFNIIPDTSMLHGCDSRPRFKPITSQINAIDTPFSFDMSATDPDGDSLVYRLTYGYDGASSACPNPSPGSGGSGCPVSASPPPYVSVAYNTPYSPTNPTNNPLDSGHLHIDPNTGMLSGRVNQTGVFLVAVATDEYRNGQLIGTTFIDYQFTFEGCTIPNAIKNTNVDPIKIYSAGNEVIIDLSTLNNPQANITFYDVLGRMIVDESNYSGNIYTKQFRNTASQYLFARVQLSDGIVIYKKLYIEN